MDYDKNIWWAGQLKVTMLEISELLTFHHFQAYSPWRSSWAKNYLEQLFRPFSHITVAPPQCWYARGRWSISKYLGSNRTHCSAQNDIGKIRGRQHHKVEELDQMPARPVFLSPISSTSDWMNVSEWSVKVLLWPLANYLEKLLIIVYLSSAGKVDLACNWEAVCSIWGLTTFFCQIRIVEST